MYQKNIFELKKKIKELANQEKIIFEKRQLHLQQLSEALKNCNHEHEDDTSAIREFNDLYICDICNERF